jgi:hypothetical protein
MATKNQAGIFWLLFILGAASVLRAVELRAGGPDWQWASVIVAGSLNQVVSAVHRAFENGSYHGMSLASSPYDYVVTNQVRLAVPQTNVWDLFDGLPLTLVPEGRKMAAYEENFVIKAEAAAPGSVRVTVRPSSSGVIEERDAWSPHLHRVLAEQYHSPLASETTNIFQRIESQLRQIQAGNTNALPPTADTTGGFYTRFWRGMSDKEQHEPQNWEKMVHAWQVLQQNATNSPSGAEKSFK